MIVQYLPMEITHNGELDLEDYNIWRPDDPKAGFEKKEYAATLGYRMFKFCCATCIQGHRSRDCTHYWRNLFFIRDRGQTSHTEHHFLIFNMVDPDFKINFAIPPLKLQGTRNKERTIVIADQYVPLKPWYTPLQRFLPPGRVFDVVNFLSLEMDRKIYRMSEIVAKQYKGPESSIEAIFDADTKATLVDIFAVTLSKEWGIDVNVFLHRERAKNEEAKRLKEEAKRSGTKSRAAAMKKVIILDEEQAKILAPQREWYAGYSEVLGKITEQKNGATKRRAERGLTRLHKAAIRTHSTFPPQQTTERIQHIPRKQKQQQQQFRPVNCSLPESFRRLSNTGKGERVSAAEQSLTMEPVEGTNRIISPVLGNTPQGGDFEFPEEVIDLLQTDYSSPVHDVHQLVGDSESLGYQTGVTQADADRFRSSMNDVLSSVYGPEFGEQEKHPLAIDEDDEDESSREALFEANDPDPLFVMGDTCKSLPVEKQYEENPIQAIVDETCEPSPDLSQPNNDLPVTPLNGDFISYDELDGFERFMGHNPAWDLHDIVSSTSPKTDSFVPSIQTTEIQPTSSCLTRHCWVTKIEEEELQEGADISNWISFFD